MRVIYGLGDSRRIQKRQQAFLRINSAVIVQLPLPPENQLLDLEDLLLSLKPKNPQLPALKNLRPLLNHQLRNPSLLISQRHLLQLIMALPDFLVARRSWLECFYNALMKMIGSRSYISSSWNKQ